MTGAAGGFASSGSAMSFAPRGPPMYTEEFRLRGILSPRVGRPMNNTALKLGLPSTPRANSARVLVSPRLPTLDGRRVEGIRPVHGQTSLSRVSISSDVPYKTTFDNWGDFVQTDPDHSDTQWCAATPHYARERFPKAHSLTLCLVRAGPAWRT